MTAPVPTVVYIAYLFHNNKKTSLLFLHEYCNSMFSSVNFFLQKFWLSLLITLSLNLKKKHETKFFTQVAFSSITLYVSLTSSFLTLCFLVTAHLILRLLTFTEIWFRQFCTLVFPDINVCTNTRS